MFFALFHKGCVLSVPTTFFFRHRVFFSTPLLGLLVVCVPPCQTVLFIFHIVFAFLAFYPNTWANFSDFLQPPAQDNHSRLTSSAPSCVCLSLAAAHDPARILFSSESGCPSSFSLRLTCVHTFPSRKFAPPFLLRGAVSFDDSSLSPFSPQIPPRFSFAAANQPLFVLTGLPSYVPAAIPADPLLAVC